MKTHLISLVVVLTAVFVRAGFALETTCVDRNCKAVFGIDSKIQPDSIKVTMSSSDRLGMNLGYKVALWQVVPENSVIWTTPNREVEISGSQTYSQSYFLQDGNSDLESKGFYSSFLVKPTYGRTILKVSFQPEKAGAPVGEPAVFEQDMVGLSETVFELLFAAAN